jgi:hypothetical protein
VFIDVNKIEEQKMTLMTIGFNPAYGSCTSKIGFKGAKNSLPEFKISSTAQENIAEAQQNIIESDTTINLKGIAGELEDYINGKKTEPVFTVDKQSVPFEKTGNEPFETLAGKGKTLSEIDAIFSVFDNISADASLFFNKDKPVAINNKKDREKYDRVRIIFLCANNLNSRCNAVETEEETKAQLKGQGSGLPFKTLTLWEATRTLRDARKNKN